MKILMLTSFPPCQLSTGGLVLDRLCRFLPRGSIASYVVAGLMPDARLSADLDWIPVRYAVCPRQRVPILSSKLLQNAFSLGMDRWNTATAIPKLVRNIVAFGKTFGADRLWCTLEGQTLIRLALPVANRLGVPLVTHICDPPAWWLRANLIDPISQRRILHCYEESIRGSVRCAAASWAMADDYHEAYGVHAVPLIPSLDENLAREPARAISDGDRLIIAIAGKIYATEEWSCLLRGLESVSWRIGGRDVVIRVLAQSLPNAEHAVRIEFLGWRPEEEVIRLLSKADVLYCPYWFDPAFEREARYGFPGKVTSYLASGRPILFHGPSYASPARFLETHQAGLCCYSLEPKEVVRALENLVGDADLYSRLAANGSQAFHENLTLRCYRKAFSEILQVKEGCLVADVADRSPV